MEVNEKEYQEFLEWKKKQIKVWKPKNGEKCWILSSHIGVLGGFEIVYDDIEHSGYYDAGLIKQTQEEIEFLIQKSKVTKELQDFADKHNEPIDWKDPRQNKFSFSYVHTGQGISIRTSYIHQCNDIYFTSEEIAHQAIETIGEDRIKKYYLGVE